MNKANAILIVGMIGLLGCAAKVAKIQEPSPLGTGITASAVGPSTGSTLFGYAVAPLVDGRCSHCVHLGQSSTVTLDAFSTVTAMGCTSSRPAFDESGRLVVVPKEVACNTATTYGVCSRGHRVVLKERHP